MNLAVMTYLIKSMKFHEIENSIQKEEMDYDDILRGNFEESFLNLTLKEKLWINWFTSFCRSDFVFKGDEPDVDIMVNSHTSKKFTLHNSSWFCRTKGMDFAKVTRNRVMSKH